MSDQAPTTKRRAPATPPTPTPEPVPAEPTPPEVEAEVEAAAEPAAIRWPVDRLLANPGILSFPRSTLVGAFHNAGLAGSVEVSASEVEKLVRLFEERPVQTEED